MSFDAVLKITEINEQNRQLKYQNMKLIEENVKLKEALNRSRWIRIAGEYANENRELKQRLEELDETR